MLSGYTTSSDNLGPPSQGRAGGVAPEAAAGQEKARGTMRQLIPVAIVFAIVAAGGAGAWYCWQQNEHKKTEAEAQIVQQQNNLVFAKHELARATILDHQGYVTARGSTSRPTR
jgi:uncharacterized protein HemX